MPETCHGEEVIVIYEYNTGYVVMDVVFPVKKGEQVVFVAYPNIKADVSITLKMYYDEVAI